jgi:Transglycosylase SLT domain
MAPSPTAVAPGAASSDLWTASADLMLPESLVSEFRVPPFLLPIYQAAGSRYGVAWEVLAAINEIETDYGRDLGVSSAGAVGWMQFMPSSWARYGVDANGDGIRDPDNPADAIFAAARYLRAAGADHDLRRAIFAYNHADWYVNAVLTRAQMIGALPSGVLDSLSALAQARFPVLGPAKYARMGHGGRATWSRRIRILTRPGAAAVAVNAGTVTRTGRSPRLGRYLQLRDVHGNMYTYARLHDLAAGSVVATAPTGSAAKERLFAHPAVETPNSGSRSRELRRGMHVAAGTILGHVGTSRGHGDGYLLFAIRPAGAGMSRLDPRPILDAWRLLRSIGEYRGAGARVVPALTVADRAISRILVQSRSRLAAQVLTDRRIQIYDCGRRDVRSGAIDRRVLAALEYLAASGLDPTVSSLRCGHSLMTSSGNVSEHASGDAVDIAAVNGIPIAGHQGPGSITELTVRRLLALRGAMKPHQIITLMRFPGAPNTLALPDHFDHIHIGWRPLPSSAPPVLRATRAKLRRRQWIQLLDRLTKIENPTVERTPSSYGVRVKFRARQQR